MRSTVKHTLAPALVLIVLGTACAESTPILRPTEEGPDAPRHRCYALTEQGQCEADDACESTWIRGADSEDLVWQCAPK